jgi:transposase
MLKLDEIVAVRVPGVAQEAARDLVRAREEARADLMRTRHRLSKLLLRQGIVYSGGKAWTGKHDGVVTRRPALPEAGRRSAFEAAYEAMVLTGDRRDRLDAAITTLATDGEFTDVVHRLGYLRGISTLTAFGLAVRSGTGTGSPEPRSALTSAWCPPRTPPGSHAIRARSPRPATATPAGFSSRPPGTTARPMPSSGQ